MVDKKIGFQIVAHIIMATLAICCLFPFALLVMSSITDEATLIREGPLLFPSKIGSILYLYLFRNAENLVAYGITIFVTVVVQFPAC